MAKAAERGPGLQAADEAAGAPLPASTGLARHSTHLADHPLVAWLIENTSIVGLACLHWLLLRRRPAASKHRGSFLQELVRSVAGGLVLIEGAILVQKVLIDHVYAHIPYFSERSRLTSRPALREWLSDWATCNLPSHILSNAAVTAALSRQSADAAKRRQSAVVKRHGPLRFLAMLAVARLAADVAFYAVHRALHSRWLYGCIHKRHHEHKAPGLVTNFHFSISDLLLEGFVPLFFAMGTLEGALRVVPSPLETSLIVLYIQWYEIGSHSGKPVPTVTYFPPLAPLYQKLLGNVDARNVEFHHLHHAKLACNYGITQWLDHALGTAKLENGEDEKQEK